MIIRFDKFDKFEIPELVLCNPDESEIGIITSYKNLSISPTFNAVSELSCDVYYLDDDLYDYIENRRRILVQDLGYFIITDSVEIIDDTGKYKQINAVSCEYEIADRKLNYIDGTYKLYDSANPDESLLGIIFPLIPKWSLGHIDTTISQKHRTFEDIVDQTVYNFLMTDVETAYDCIIEFDILNKVVNFYDKNTFVNQTDIFLSRDTLLDKININENDGEMVTCLFVTGGNDLDISLVNPLGSNIIYDFSHYKNTKWMSQELIDAIDEWEDKVAASELIYRQKLSQIVAEESAANSIRSTLTGLESDLELYERQKAVAVSEGVNLSEINGYIKGTKSAIATTTAELKTKTDNINRLNQERHDISVSLSFEESFTKDQFAILSSYIIEGNYQEDNITRADDFSYEEWQNQSLELYNKAKELLEVVSKPRYELSVDTKGFIFNKEFAHFSEQLKSGCLIDVEIDESAISSFILLKFEIDFENKDLVLTFGNRYRLHDPSSLYSDLYDATTKTTSTVSYNKDLWNYPVKSNKINEMDLFMNSSLDLTKNSIISSYGQNVQINETGYRGTKEVSGDIDPEELWITHNTIAFTDDSWETAKTALGKLIMPDGTTKYGLNAEMVIGEMIVGQNLNISNENNSFVVDENGVYIEGYATSGDIYDLESQLSIQADQISQKVSWSDVEDIISGANLIMNSPSAWEQGTINEETGEDDGATTRIRTVGGIGVSDEEEYTISSPTLSPFEYCCHFYESENGAHLGHLEGLWLNELPFTFTPPTEATYMRVVIKIADDVAITPDIMLSEIKLKIEIGSEATPFSLNANDLQTQMSSLTQTAKDYEIAFSTIGVDGFSKIGKTTFDVDGQKIFNGSLEIYKGSDTNSEKLFYTDIDGNLTISGIVNAIGGKIGGYNVTQNSIRSVWDGNRSSGMQVGTSGVWAFWAGADSLSSYSNAPFRVSHVGKLYATDAEIGGFTTDSGHIYSYNENTKLYTTMKKAGDVFLACGSPRFNNTSNAAFQILHNGNLNSSTSDTQIRMRSSVVSSSERTSYIAFACRNSSGNMEEQGRIGTYYINNSGTGGFDISGRTVGVYSNLFRVNSRGVLIEGDTSNSSVEIDHRPVLSGNVLWSGSMSGYGVVRLLEPATTFDFLLLRVTSNAGNRTLIVDVAGGTRYATFTNVSDSGTSTYHEIYDFGVEHADSGWLLHIRVNRSVRIEDNLSSPSVTFNHITLQRVTGVRLN